MAVPQAGYGYYDPSYAGYAAAPPGIQMSKEQKQEARMARKAKKLEEASKRCEKLREKQKEQQAKDASCFLIFMSIGFLGLGTLMGLTIVGSSWGSKEFTGLGVGLVTMHSSLFSMKIDISCDKSFMLEEGLCKKVLKPFEGTHDLQRVQGNACALVPSACEVLGRCYYASIPLFICIALSVLSSFSAAFCLFTYSKSVADPALRQWANAFTLATPVLATGGIVTWAVMMPDLGEIPRSWSTLAMGFGLSDAFGYTETRDFQFGWTFFAACIIDFCMIITGFIWFCMFRRSDDEDEVIQQAAKDKAFCDELERDRGARMDYGATGTGGKKGGQAAAEEAMDWGQAAADKDWVP